MRMTVFLLSIIFCSLLASAQTAEKWDLQKSVEYAIKHNISVRQADIQARFSELNLKQSKASQFPNLNIGLSSTYNFGRNENPTTGVLEDNNYLSAGMN